ncbi:isopentenyl phosphate kinase [uncultured Shewanella sp.]|uniref:isopentenyl phosphate kinase n=1 Tax=uncultured Shewanella sp. TaxID=173975 RepID=UPI002622CD38|nr:isopentenyl phosphate kinase [uncultured Shewanella sp.]
MMLNNPLIIKLGGSIITDRQKPYTLEKETCRHLIKKIKKLKQQSTRPIVLILGGGSFGHPSVHQYNLANAGSYSNLQQFSRLTLSLYQLVQEFMEVGYEESVDFSPFQSNSLFVSRNGQIERVFDDPITNCFKLNHIPLLTGGVAFDLEKGQMIFGSDRVPELIATMYPSGQSIFVSDIDGVYDASKNQIYKRITPTDYEAICHSIFESQKLDVTNGMQGKVDSAMRLVHLGVESVICSVSTFLNQETKQILSKGLKGTYFSPYETAIDLKFPTEEKC